MLSQEVKERIETGLLPSQCFVNEFSGGNDHYSVIVISPRFEGTASLARHRMVMELFATEVGTGEVHALSIQAFTPIEWERKKHQFISSP